MYKKAKWRMWGQWDQWSEYINTENLLQSKEKYYRKIMAANNIKVCLRITIIMATMDVSALALSSNECLGKIIPFKEAGRLIYSV